MPISRFSDLDIHLFKQGKHYKLYEKFGAHVMEHEGTIGTYFAVWAPNAQAVCIIGNFNGWNTNAHHLSARWDQSGIWELWIPNVGNNEVYKYAITTRSGEILEKADPFAYWAEVAPRTASIVCDTYFEWKDTNWMSIRASKNSLTAPISVYEVHLDSWLRDPNNPNRHLTWKEISHKLVPYVKEMGFTHVEFMPVMEHPYPPSWGYQVTGYYSCSARNGTPQELMYLIDELHQAGIGVYLDWVPSHFPGDAHGLFQFDGTSLYEHEDPRLGYHPDWKSYIFNFGRHEVRSFLISNALFWLERYHIDGLRVDAVASMLYLDYSRKEGEWIPNEHGGRENLQTIQFLKELNTAVYSHFPDVQTIAEESTSFPGVSRPTYIGGLGFGMKWMMGWMNDTLSYFERETFYRKWHQDQITFSLVYAFAENFMLPLSHDEVVYGKHSLINKMPGDTWQKFANLRLLYSYMFTHPGTKLMFMGGEFGQLKEWNFERSLDWHLLNEPPHKGIQKCVADLNKLYQSEKSLFEKNFDASGFEWIDTRDKENATLVYSRIGESYSDRTIIVLNMLPNTNFNYRIGVPSQSTWREIFNSDQPEYGGSGVQNLHPINSEDIKWHGKEHSISLSVPPLGATILKAIEGINNQ